MHPAKNKFLVVAPDEPGFRQYADDLACAGRELIANDARWKGFACADPVYFRPLLENSDVDSLVAHCVAVSPDLIHIHHEFGFMGSKIPGRYRFVELKRKLRFALPKAKVIATAHTVIGRSFEYPWRNRGWQTPLRLAANRFVLPSLKRLWMEKSWGDLDGVIVHSSLQIQSVLDSSCKRVHEIPHYVPAKNPDERARLPGSFHALPEGATLLLVFGYFTPEKAQDVAIAALQHLEGDIHLVLAGGLRRKADEPYLKRCQDLIQALKVEDRVQITGFISFPELDALVARAHLVLLPFRETSGSGSLADLMTRRAPVLASDLPLNLEIARRTPGSLEYFRSEDASDCATAIKRLVRDPARIAALRKGAEAYADAHSPERMMQNHLKFYSEILSQKS